MVDFIFYKYDEKTLKNQILYAASQREITEFQKRSAWKKQKKEKNCKENCKTAKRRSHLLSMNERLLVFD